MNSKTVTRIAALVPFLFFAAACVPPKTGGSTRTEVAGTVTGSSSKPYNCTAPNANNVKTCDFSYSLKVESEGETRRIPVDAVVHSRCQTGDGWPSCADR